MSLDYPDSILSRVSEMEFPIRINIPDGDIKYGAITNTTYNLNPMQLSGGAVSASLTELVTSPSNTLKVSLSGSGFQFYKFAPTVTVTSASGDSRTSAPSPSLIYINHPLTAPSYSLSPINSSNLTKEFSAKDVFGPDSDPWILNPQTEYGPQEIQHDFVSGSDNFIMSENDEFEGTDYGAIFEYSLAPQYIGSYSAVYRARFSDSFGVLSNYGGNFTIISTRNLQWGGPTSFSEEDNGLWIRLDSDGGIRVMAGGGATPTIVNGERTSSSWIDNIGINEGRFFFGTYETSYYEVMVTDISGGPGGLFRWVNGARQLLSKGAWHGLSSGASFAFGISSNDVRGTYNSLIQLSIRHRSSGRTYSVNLNLSFTDDG